MIRGATLVHGLSLLPGRALCGVPSYPRQLTYALTSWSTPLAVCQVQLPWFDHALSGPFDDLFLTRLSAARALWKGIIAVISASTVCCCVLVYHVSPPLSTGQNQICHFNSYGGHRMMKFLTISQGHYMSFVLLSRSSKNSFMRMRGLRRTRPSSSARGMKTKSFSRSSQ